MRKLIVLSFVLLLVGINLSAGNPDFLTVLKNKSYVFNNKKCEKNNSCSLKKVSYYLEDYTVLLTDSKDKSIPERYNYATRFYASYETESVEALEDYVFVVFVKGCVYNSKLENKKVVEWTEVYGPYFGSNRLFKFKDWAVDSRDNDPAYNSLPGFGRHDGYTWNNTEYFNDKNETLYKDKRPTTPILYITDRVATSLYEKGTAKNTSLNLKTCIYKTKDVPLEGSLYDTSFAKPIHCYEWSSSFIFNHKEMKFEQPKGIASACKK